MQWWREEGGEDDEGIMISDSSTVAKRNVTEGGKGREPSRVSHSQSHMLVTASNPYSRKTATHITHARHDGDGDEASFLPAGGPLAPGLPPLHRNKAT